MMLSKHLNWEYQRVSTGRHSCLVIPNVSQFLLNSAVTMCLFRTYLATSTAFSIKTKFLSSEQKSLINKLRTCAEQPFAKMVGCFSSIISHAALVGYDGPAVGYDGHVFCVCQLFVDVSLKRQIFAVQKNSAQLFSGRWRIRRAKFSYPISQWRCFGERKRHGCVINHPRKTDVQFFFLYCSHRINPFRVFGCRFHIFFITWRVIGCWNSHNTFLLNQTSKHVGLRCWLTSAVTRSFMVAKFLSIPYDRLFTSSTFSFVSIFFVKVIFDFNIFHLE